MVLVTNILPSIIFIIVGIILKFLAPEEINGVLGYRTFFAMKNKETWKEGNNFSGIMAIMSGSISLVFSILITLICKSDPSLGSKISDIGSLIFVFGCIFYTEIHLRKTFDQNGKRKLNINRT